MRIAASLYLGLLGLLGAHPLAAEAPAEVVRLQLKWMHQFQFAGYYAALAKGFYREAGLDVQLREAQPGRDPTHEVLAGRAEYGVGNSDLLLMRHRGERVVVLATIFQHSPMVLLVRADSGVTDVQGLHDRELMMLASESAELFAYFKFEGLDPAKLRIRTHTLNIEDFIAGRVDGMSAYGTDEPYNLRTRGVSFLQFTPRAGGIDFYGDNLFTTEAEIRAHPARARAFRAASLRGWEYALAHPEEIIDLILRDYPRRLTRDHLRFEAEQTAALMHPGLIEVGHMNPGRWRHIAETYAEFGMLPRDFDFTGFLYDPNPRPDHRWVYWSLAGAGVLLVAALGWALPLARLNRQLRAAKEAAESANEAKGRYLAFMSHELRTPLNGILGFINLLKAGPLQPEQRQEVDLLEHSAQDLLRLIDGVLDASKLEADRVEAEWDSVDPAALLRGVHELYRATARVKKIECECTVGAGVPAAIHTDPSKLRQILSNLTANALKFTPRGRVDLRLDLRSTPAGPRLAFSVADTGVGIPADQLERIFEAYAQADASVARRFGGTGLGLFISQHLARLLGSGVTVTSTPGQGSIFTLELPLDGRPRGG